MARTPGLQPRRAALKMLDAVLRRGETLEQAGGAANGLPAFSDRALAKVYRTIAAELHPDRPDGDAERFTQLGLAYERLKKLRGL